MSYRVIIEEDAKTDIKEALHWMSQFSPERAPLWYFNLQDAIDSLENFPHRCPLAPENDAFPEEIRHLLFEKYRIIYTVRDESVHVLHIRHSSRRPLTPDDQ